MRSPLQYAGYTGRHPYTTDAFKRGYTPGVREDYRYQADSYPNVDTPVQFLDNDYRDPDIDRYLKRFDRYDQSVAVLGDVYTPRQARRYAAAADRLVEKHPWKTYIVAPKSRGTLDALTHTESVTLGHPAGYSVDPGDYSTPGDWRGHDVHGLGGSPQVQRDVIRELTGPRLDDTPPANITGLDWNGPHKVAYKGEYWSRDGWQPADHLSIRGTVRHSLDEIRRATRRCPAGRTNSSAWPGH